MRRLTLGFISLRTGASAFLLPTLLLAFYLSVEPHFHERIHRGANTPTHQCAVTIFAFGNCEDTAGDRIVVAATPLPPSPAFLLQRPSIFVAALEISILEHAPPVYS
jgi:hypothetical protein